MSSPVQPEIIVEMRLLSCEEGGRRSPIRQGEYRGILGIGSENFSARFFVPVPQGISSNGVHRLGVQFLFPEAALPHFPIGTSFNLWEGHIIGNGKVVEVLHHG